MIPSFRKDSVMLMKFYIGLLLIAMCMVSTGCLLVSTGNEKVRLVREREARKEVVFENDTAAQTFDKVYQRELGNNTIGRNNSGTLLIPFICAVVDNTTTTKVAPNAVYNDCLARCDLDQNGIITEEEARKYAE